MKFLDRIKELGSSIKRSDQIKTKVAADLSVLIARAGLKRKDIAQRLQTSDANLSIRLSGTQNLTIESISSISEAAGFDFDIVFRTPDMPRAHSFFELEEPISGEKLAQMKLRKLKVHFRAPVFNGRAQQMYSFGGGCGSSKVAANHQWKFALDA